MIGPRSSLARWLPVDHLTDDELRAMARKAWLDRGIVVLFPNQPINWLERAAIEGAARKLYGQRSDGGPRS